MIGCTCAVRADLPAVVSAVVVVLFVDGRGHFSHFAHNRTLCHVFDGKTPPVRALNGADAPLPQSQSRTAHGLLRCLCPAGNLSEHIVHRAPVYVFDRVYPAVHVCGSQLAQHMCHFVARHLDIGVGDIPQALAIL